MSQAYKLMDDEALEMLLGRSPRKSEVVSKGDVKRGADDKDEKSLVQEVQEVASTTSPEKAAVKYGKNSSSSNASDHISSPQNRSETLSARDPSPQPSAANLLDLYVPNFRSDNFSYTSGHPFILRERPVKPPNYHRNTNYSPLERHLLKKMENEIDMNDASYIEISSDSEMSSINAHHVDHNAPMLDQQALEAADLADNSGMMSILAGISLKSLFSPVNGLFTNPDMPWPNDLSMIQTGLGVPFSQIVWDSAGHLNTSTFSDVVGRARLVLILVGNIILCRYNVLMQRMPPTTAVRDYLAFLTDILPQLHYLAETGIGNSLTAQAAGSATAWNLLWSALGRAVVPFYENFNPIERFNNFDRYNLAKIDDTLAIIFARKFKATMDEVDYRGVHIRYTGIHMHWVKVMEEELLLITTRLNYLNNGTAFMGGPGAVGGFLNKTVAVWRNTMAEYGRLTMLYGLEEQPA